MTISQIAGMRLVSREFERKIRNAAFEEAARIADNGMLVPPDGGSPTVAECEMCDRIAASIRALITVEPSDS